MSLTYLSVTTASKNKLLSEEPDLHFTTSITGMLLTYLLVQVHMYNNIYHNIPGRIGSKISLVRSHNGLETNAIIDRKSKTLYE